MNTVQRSRRMLIWNVDWEKGFGMVLIDFQGNQKWSISFSPTEGGREKARRFLETMNRAMKSSEAKNWEFYDRSDEGKKIGIFHGLSDPNTPFILGLTEALSDSSFHLRYKELRQIIDLLVSYFNLRG